MTIETMAIDIGGKLIRFTHDEANDQTSVHYGGTTVFLLDNSDEDTLWALAHSIYRYAYGHSCCAGDVRSLFMVLGLICS